MKTSVASGNTVVDTEQDYWDFLQSIRDHFNALVDAGKPIFQTNTGELFTTFLDNLPAPIRQHYTCHACQDFVNTFGGLVVIEMDGQESPIMWGTVPEVFQPAIDAIKKKISKARVTGIFLTDEKVWGKPVTGEWHHMAVQPPAAILHKSKVQTPGQVMAEKREDYKLAIAGLQEYPLDAVNQAVKLLKSDALYRSEKVLGVAEWLKKLHVARSSTRNSKVKENITWLFVATAPAGFCHIKSTMIGTLLDDIVSGMDFNQVSRRFAEKMHPLQYQRPSAAPATGNIEQAEKLVETLGIASSLKRRFARLDEIQALWMPAKASARVDASGVFAHLKPAKKEVKTLSAPEITMTWDKFCKIVLPEALAIEYQVQPHSNYSAILTSINESDPPILQWDKEDQRNPCSHYVYNGGSMATHWNLNVGTIKVSAVCYQPSMWNNGPERHGKSVIFILDGCKDLRSANCGLAIFPETLKSELHGIRQTIEAYSRAGTLEGLDEASACGIRLQAGSTWDGARFIVTTAEGKQNYRLDRWD